MSDFEFDGEKLLRALKDARVSNAVIEALIGCDFYVDNPDHLARIIAYDERDCVFVLQTPVGELRRNALRLAQGYIIEPRDRSLLEPLLDQATPAYVKQSDRARRRLADAGVHSALISRGDASRLAELLLDHLDAWPPPRVRRDEIFGLLTKYGLYPAVIRYGEQWLDLAEQQDKPADVDVLIQLGSAYRQTGNLEAAMRITEFAAKPHASSRLSPSALSVLLTIRAATHLDLFERDRVAIRLASARKCAARSYAIQPSEQCSMVYRRLAKLEDSSR